MDTSKLLYDEHTLVINPELAQAIGLNEAIVLQQIHYWTRLNKEKDINFYEDHYWTYNTFEEWQKQFPFWSIITIKRIMKRLETKDLIITGCFNKAGFDRTRWYRVNEAGLTPTDIKRILAKMSRKATMGDALEAIAEKAYQQGRADEREALSSYLYEYYGSDNTIIEVFEEAVEQALQRGEEKG